MLRKRVIPCLLLRNESLVKTVKFNNPGYIGDSTNTVRIFNELEVDELLFLDIMATREKRGPNFKILQEISDECFMPLAYGGGVRDFETAKKIFKMGFEKIAINSYAFENPSFITQLSDHFGAQAIIGSIDIKKNLWGKLQVYGYAGKKNMRKDPVEWAEVLEKLGVGELLITSMDKEGTWDGFDFKLTQLVADAVSVPIIANGGAGNISHIKEVLNTSNASAVALGSMVVYQKKGSGVLINFPSQKKIESILHED